MMLIRNLILAVRVLWAVRRGPCLHPAYCCQLPPGQRWAGPVRAAAAALGLAALLALVLSLAWWGGWLWLTLS